MDIPQNISVTLKALQSNDFDARFARTGIEARDIMLGMIPNRAKVGVADSVTLRQIGILEALEKRGNEIINPFRPEMTEGMDKDLDKQQQFVKMLRQTFTTDVLITGSNAVTEDGNLVSIDGAGNRVAGIIYGAPKVILAIGRNKIVKDTAEAINRIKNVLAPAHAAQKHCRTPCAKTGECADCDSPNRICNVTVILEKKPYHTNLSVILIDEDLGLGWNPTWDEQRIAGIKENYIKYSWPF